MTTYPAPDWLARKTGKIPLDVSLGLQQLPKEPPQDCLYISQKNFGTEDCHLGETWVCSGPTHSELGNNPGHLTSLRPCLESLCSPVSKKTLNSCCFFPTWLFFPLNLTPAGKIFRNHTHTRSRNCHFFSTNTLNSHVINTQCTYQVQQFVLKLLPSQPCGKSPKLHSHETTVPLHPRLPVRFIHHIHSRVRALVFHSLISDSCRTSTAAWPWNRGKSDASFWTHLFQFYSHVFLPFPKSALFFSLSYRLTSGSGHFLLGWWQLSQLRNSYCSTLPRLPPTPMTLQCPFPTPPFPLPFALRTRVTLLFPGMWWGNDSHVLRSPGWGAWASGGRRKRPALSVGSDKQMGRASWWSCNLLGAVAAS